MGGHRRDQSDSKVPLRGSVDYSSPESAPGSFTELYAIESREMTIVGDSPMRHEKTHSDGSNHTCMVNIEEDDDPQRQMSAPATKQVEVVGGSDAIKTCTAFFCLLISAFLNFFLLTVIHDFVPREPLPDIVFMAFPQQRWAWSVGDVLSTLSSVVAFGVVLLHRHRWVVLRRMFLLGAIMYGMRAVIMSVTFLPPSFHNRDTICMPQVNRSHMYGIEIATRFITYVVTLGLTSGQDKILCGDLMFSGHTVVLTLMFFVIQHYTPEKLALLRYVMVPITFAGIGALVLSGGHYTMDVVIAYWLTSHVFWAYHQLFEMPRVMRTHAPLTRLWWYWPAFWFETTVPEGPLENKWDWPFPGPKFAIKAITRLNDSSE